MRHPAVPSRSAGVDGRAFAVLLALAGALVVAFVAAPRTLAASLTGGGFADQAHLVDVLRAAFVQYWRSGDRDLSVDLERVVDYWLGYHLAKAAIAASLLVVLVALDVLVWRAFLRAGVRGPAGRAATASAGVLVTALAVLSLVTAMANVQGAVAPFAALLPLLVAGAPDGEVADTLAHVRQQLADVLATGHQPPPALGAMISDFTRYHQAMVVIAAAVAIALIGTTVVTWNRWARTGASDRRTKRVVSSFQGLAVVVSLFVIVVAVANATTVADPAPALLAFFDGGW